MEMNFEGDNYLDYLNETLERLGNFRVVSLHHRALMIRHVACFNGRIPVGRANRSERLPCLQRRSLGSDS